MKQRLPYYVVLLVGVAGYFHVSHQADFASIRSVNVLELLASGVCFGIFLAAAGILPRRPAPPQAAPGADRGSL